MFVAHFINPPVAPTPFSEESGGVHIFARRRSKC